MQVRLACVSKGLNGTAILLETAVFFITQIYSEVVDAIVGFRIVFLVASKTVLTNKSIFCITPIIYSKLPKNWRDKNRDILKHKYSDILLKKFYYHLLTFLM